MTLVDAPRDELEPLDADAASERALPDEPPPDLPPGAPGDDDAPPALALLIRPVLAAALATSAAGLVAGGIFGSWPARLTGLVGAFAGAAWALVTLRSSRPAVLQAMFPPALLLAAAGGIVLRGESPADLPSLVGDAITAGRLFRPPIPFDPGWTPILFVLLALVGFASAWVGAALDRAKLGVVIPIPIIGLTAITQPDDGQFIAGICAFLPVLAALGVLFGGDTDRAETLDGAFEAKRAVRGLVAAVPIVAVLVALSNASFLFPEPVYDPTEQPQKPRAVPLSAADDRVLFEVATDADLTGPWRAGVLDVYDPEDGFWKSPPRDLGDVPDGAVVSEIRASVDQLEVTITVRDLGNSAVFPMPGGTTTIDFPGGVPDKARLDRRTGLLRVESGRVPPGTVYTASLPPYATDAQLEAAAVPRGDGFDEQLAMPDPPHAVQVLLDEAPENPWLRLDALRKKLLGTVVASGAGTPVAVSAERVGELFEDKAKASPYEIVAAEAMLARWAGVPARLGFGFDGLNVEDDLFTVRPRNSAQWLEVYFEGYGWLPLIGAPQQAESTLDSDPNARFNPTIEPSDDVAVQIYLPFRVEDLTQLFERIRAIVLRWLPLAAGLAIGYVLWPAGAKAYRRSKRRRWAAAIGPRAQIAVEYAELRDLATDLNVADIYSTPLEFVYAVRDDEEHAELAWLVARALYGDLARTVTDVDAAAAERMGASVRRRLTRGQPLQSQLLAHISRASITLPYTAEVPNVRQLPRPRLPRLPRLSRRLPRPRRRPVEVRA